MFCQEDLERVLEKKPSAMTLAGFRDPLFEQLFSKINIYKTPCPEGVCRRRYHSVNQPDISDKQTKSIRIVTIDLGSPLRGRTALRVQSSYGDVPNHSLPWALNLEHHSRLPSAIRAEKDDILLQRRSVRKINVIQFG